MAINKLNTSLPANNSTAKLTNHFYRTRLTNTIYLTMKITFAHVVETSITINSFLQNYSHSDDHTQIQYTGTPPGWVQAIHYG